MTQIPHFLVVKINKLLLLIEWISKNVLGFAASSWSLSSSSNLAGTAELPAWDEFDFPFQLVKHKCEGKKLNIEEKP